MTLLSVFASSAAALSFEVLLTRLFAITQWNHLSFMVISVAMLGFAAGGIVVATGVGRGAALFPIALALLPAGLLLGFQVAARTRLDYFQLAVDPSQLLRLAGLFAALACPFVLAGLVTALAYSGGAAARVYLASMAGSALGAILPAALLPAAGLARAFVVVALLPVGPALAVIRGDRGSRPRWGILAATAAPIPVALVLLVFPGLVEVQPNEYKAFSHYTKMVGVAAVSRYENLRARYDELAGDPIRFAPGLSLRYTDRLPVERLILEDGDRRHVLPDPDDPLSDTFARSLLASAAYLLPQRLDRVLILHADGGVSALTARAAGARSIDLVTDQPYLARRFAAHYGSRLNRVICASARAFLAAPGDLYDVIQVESWGTQLPAMASLAEDHWLTVEAVRAMLSRLAPGGILSFNRALDLPPNDLLRLLNTTWKALGGVVPEWHTAAFRSWDSLLLVVSPEPLSDAARSRMLAFADRMRFDPVQMQGVTADQANRYNQMARPYHFEAARALAAGTLDPGSPFDVSALTDTRPYPYHYLRWWRLPSAWRALGDRLYSLALSGEVMLLLVLATAVSLSVLILVVPAALARRASNGRSGVRQADRPFPITFFLATGAGYMLFELGWLAALGLLLENPSLAFAAGAGGLLLASGAGGIVGARTERLLLSLAAAAAAGIGLAGALAVATPWLLPLPPWPRAAAAAAALLPCGFVLGMPFPLGLRRREAGPGRGGLAYAWAANGASSVVASVLAPFVSMSWGTPMLFACAGACYAVALAAADSARTRAPSPDAGAPTGGLPSRTDAPSGSS